MPANLWGCGRGGLLEGAEVAAQSQLGAELNFWPKNVVLIFSLHETGIKKTWDFAFPPLLLTNSGAGSQLLDLCQLRLLPWGSGA